MRRAKAERAVATNRTALHDYTILDSVEAGLVLTGSEIKSIRAGRVSLRDSYARPEGGELWLVGAHIARYDASGVFGHDPGRPRKLLLHRNEINELTSQVTQKGLTLVPLRLYIKRGKAKVELALARGKRRYDKRQALARRSAEREVQRALRSRDRR